EIEPDEEPPRGIMWLKGRVNKDEKFLDDEIRSVGDKLKETENKIKEGTLKVDHGTDAMTVVLEKELEIQNLSNKMSKIEGMVTKRMNQLAVKKEHLQSMSTKFTPSNVSSVDINPVDNNADEVDKTPLSVVGCENDASIQKSNGLATSEKEIETSTNGKQMLHNKELPEDCYKVSVGKSLVDAACIPNVGNNGFKTVKDAVGGFFAWTKNQVVLDPKRPMLTQDYAKILTYVAGGSTYWSSRVDPDDQWISFYEFDVDFCGALLLIFADLISNQHKIEQNSIAFLSDESSAILQNKVPPKLEDPRSFLISFNFKTFSCNALADLGANINLMPYSLYAKLSLQTLKPTKMSVRLAHKSFQYPFGIAENMLVEVGKFTFHADFIILEMEEDSKVPLILGRPFLYTTNAVIRVKQKQLNLGIRTERMIFNIDFAMKHSYSNNDTCFSIDVIDEILEEDFYALSDEGSKILYSIEGTLHEEEIFSEFNEFIAMTADENSESEIDTKEPPFEKITINIDYKNQNISR
nr:reverse transcriptase domain-containing protein [Tanacetum cinerariifolium]